MVVFTCNKCGDALKKAQVEKHYQTKCRDCNVLSCLDCGKDFWGNDYEQHTKCISEEEKYSGKNYVPKANANKGEVKQLAWLQQVQNAIDKVKTNPRLKDLLERMKDYPNIPRKKNKFENFISNSLKVWDKSLAASVWDLLMANTETKPAVNSTTDQNTTNNKSDSSNSDNATNHLSDNTSEPTDRENSKKLSKRERKEERRKHSHKVEKKERHGNDDSHVDNGENESGRANKSKKKKRKHADEDSETLSKKHKRDESEEEVEENDIAEEEEGDSEPEKKRYKTKFDWEDVIARVLRAKGSEMPIKKVKKKVLAEYLAQGCTEKSEEKLWAKFEKKLRKNPAFKVFKDRVKLVS